MSDEPSKKAASGPPILAAAVIAATEPAPPLATTGSPSNIDRLISSSQTSDDVVEVELRDTQGNPVIVRLLLDLAPPSDLKPPTADHVLIVDDEQQNRSYYEEVLSNAGYDVLVAATGQDGYRAALRHRPAIVLLDVRLPDTNGYEVARLIRSSAELDDVPILLMSSDPDLAIEARITSAGAAGFLVTPLSPDRLLTAVKLHRRPPGPAHQTAPSSGATEEREDQPHISLFGHPTVSDAWRTFTVPAGRASELLATLALSAPNPVSTDRLAQLVWAEGNDASAGAVYTAMSRLRTSLTKAGFGDVLESDATGYRLTVDPNDIDVLAFDRTATNLVKTADAHGVELTSMTRVLDLWTNEPFQSRTDNELIGRFNVRLHETRAQLLECIALSYLLAESPSEATAVLQVLLADEPWRENAWALLVTALYRAGRQRDALEAFQQARSRMAHELGVDPGPRLSSCELMILNHDPELLTSAWVQSLHT